LLEAFECGLAAICTKAGGTAELIRDGVNGLLCDVEDSEAIAKSMKRLIEDAELRSEMGRLNRRIVRSFMSTTAKAKALLGVYSSHSGDEPLTALPDIDGLIKK